GWSYESRPSWSYLHQEELAAQLLAIPPFSMRQDEVDGLKREANRLHQEAEALLKRAKEAEEKYQTANRTLDRDVEREIEQQHGALIGDSFSGGWFHADSSPDFDPVAAAEPSSIVNVDREALLRMLNRCIWCEEKHSPGYDYLVCNWCQRHRGKSHCYDCG